MIDTALAGSATRFDARRDLADSRSEGSEGAQYNVEASSKQSEKRETGGQEKLSFIEVLASNREVVEGFGP